MKIKIIKAPNDILRKKVDDTTLIDDKYRVVAEYMLQTLQQYNAAGLAANQVGYDMPMIAIRIPENKDQVNEILFCLLYTSPSPRDRQKSRMPSSA